MDLIEALAVGLAGGAAFWILQRWADTWWAKIRRRPRGDEPTATRPVERLSDESWRLTATDDVSLDMDITTSPPVALGHAGADDRGARLALRAGDPSGELAGRSAALPAGAALRTFDTQHAAPRHLIVRTDAGDATVLAESFPIGLGSSENAAISVPGVPYGARLLEEGGVVLVERLDAEVCRLGGRDVGRTPVPVTGANAVLEIDGVVVLLDAVVAVSSKARLDLQLTHAPDGAIVRTGAGTRVMLWQVGRDPAELHDAADTIIDSLVSVTWGPEVALRIGLEGLGGDVVGSLQGVVAAAGSHLDTDYVFLAGLGTAQIYREADKGWDLVDRASSIPVGESGLVQPWITRVPHRSGVRSLLLQGPRLGSGAHVDLEALKGEADLVAELR